MAETPASIASNKMVWAGRIVSGLVVAALLMSGGFKLSQSSEVLKEFTRLGYLESHSVKIGILEIVCVLLYAVPQTSVLGAILLTGYLGGATATHVRLSEPFIAPVIIGVMVWIGLYLRDARLRALAPWRRV